MNALMDLKTWNKPDAFVLQKRYPVEAAHDIDPEFADLFDYVEYYDGDVCWSLLERMAPGVLFHVIDTSAHDPAGWTFERYGVHDLDGQQDYTGTAIGAYPVKTYAEHLQSSYVTARSQATFNAITWSPHGPPRRYYRGIVPCSDGKLFVFSRLQKFGVGLQLVPHLSAGNHGDMDLSGLLGGRKIVRRQAGKAARVAVSAKWKGRLSQVAKNVSAVEVGLWLLERYGSD